MSRRQQLRDALWYQCVHLVASTLRMSIVTTVGALYPRQVCRAVLSVWLLGWFVLDVGFWPLRVRDVQHWRSLYRRQAELDTHHPEWLRFQQRVRGYRCLAWAELYGSLVGLPFLVMRPRDRTTAPAAYWTAFVLYMPLMSVLVGAATCTVIIVTCMMCNTLTESCTDAVSAQMMALQRRPPHTDRRHVVVVLRERNDDDTDTLKRGLDDAALAHLPCVQLPPTNPATTDSAPPECAICLTALEPGDECRRLACSHMYHRACADPWLRRVAVCPLCKAPVHAPRLPPAP
jgi:hypothetical protein